MAGALISRLPQRMLTAIAEAESHSSSSWSSSRQPNQEGVIDSKDSRRGDSSFSRGGGGVHPSASRDSGSQPVSGSLDRDGIGSAARVSRSSSLAKRRDSKESFSQYELLKELPRAEQNYNSRIESSSIISDQSGAIPPGRKEVSSLLFLAV